MSIILYLDGSRILRMMVVVWYDREVLWTWKRLMEKTRLFWSAEAPQGDGYKINLQF